MIEIGDNLATVLEYFAVAIIFCCLFYNNKR